MAEGPKTMKSERITLDGQLIGYWEREAEKFEALAKNAMFRWIARGYARRAARARALAERSRLREAARGHPDKSA